MAERRRGGAAETLVRNEGVGVMMASDGGMRFGGLRGGAMDL